MRAAVWMASLALASPLPEEVGRVLEKNNREVSSIGWNKIRATREPAAVQRVMLFELKLRVDIP